MTLGKVLGWILVPYVMVFLEWKKSNIALKAYGLFTAFLIFISVIVAAFSDQPLESTESKKVVQEEPKIETKPKPLTEAEKKEKRKQELKNCFMNWDGSHTNLTNLIKENMNDPDSYKHVETTYRDYKDYLIVTTSFRGSNAFGAIVKNTVNAKVSTDGKCSVIEIIE